MKQKISKLLMLAVMMFALSITAFATGETTDTENAIAKTTVNGTETYYTSLYYAFNAVSGSDTHTIDLLKETEESSVMKIDSGETVVFNMNGNKITYTASGARAINNAGTLTLNGNGGAVTATNKGVYGVFDNSGEAVVYDVTFTTTTSQEYSANIRNLYNLNDGTNYRPQLTLNNVNVRSEDTTNYATYLVLNYDGDMTINGGNYYMVGGSGSGGAYAVQTYSNTTVKGATIYGGKGAFSISGGVMTIDGGTYTGDTYYGCYVAGEVANASAKIYSGTFISNARQAIYIGNDNVGGDGGINADASTVIYGGTFNGATGYDALHSAQNTGSPYILGGSFSSDISSYVVDGYECTLNTETSMYDVTAVETSEDSVAQIDKQGYSTLATAILAAQDGETVTLLSDVSEDTTILATSEIILDLNGFTLSNVSSHTITNYGKLTVVDSSDEKTGTVICKTAGVGALYNQKGAVAILDGGNFTRNETIWYTISNAGTMTINDGVLVDENDPDGSTEGDNASLIRNGENADLGQEATMTITGGTFDGGLVNVKNDCWGILDISGGTFQNAVTYAVYNAHKATITGGNFSCNGTVNVHSIYASEYNEVYSVDEMTVTGGNYTKNTYLDYYFPLGYEVAENTQTIDGITYSYTVQELDGVCVALVNSEGATKYYASVGLALTDAVSGDTVTVIGDCTDTSKCTVQSGITLIIAENATWTITGANVYFYNEGEVIVYGSIVSASNLFNRAPFTNNGSVTFQTLSNTSIEGTVFNNNGHVKTTSSLSINVGDDFISGENATYDLASSINVYDGSGLDFAISLGGTRSVKGSSTIDVTSNITIPSTYTLAQQNNSVLNIAKDVIFTIEGKVTTTASASINNSGTIVVNGTVTNKGTITNMVGASITNEDNITNSGNGSVVWITGDIDADGVIDVTDVSLVLQIATGAVTDEAMTARADLNGDGTVNSLDAVVVYSLIS